MRKKGMKPLLALREMMERAGYSQRALSKKIGRHNSYVGVTLSKESSIEAGNFIAMANAMDFKVMCVGHGIEFELKPTLTDGLTVEG